MTDLHSGTSGNLEVPKPEENGKELIHIDGCTFTEEELIDIIVYGEKFQVFSLGGFLNAWLAHMLSFSLPPPVSYIAAWIVVGFNF